MVSEYFAESELVCKCGCEDSDMDRFFLLMLDALRRECGRPLSVTSAKRCPKHNAKVGGTSDSAHLLGKAADISAVTGREKFQIVQAAMTIGFKRIGVAKGFVHVDSADDRKHPSPTIWTY